MAFKRGNRVIHQEGVALCNTEGGDHSTETRSTWMFNKDILRTSCVFGL